MVPAGTTFARVADPVGAFKESLEFDIGTIGHEIHTRPLTRYAGAADIPVRCARKAATVPTSIFEALLQMPLSPNKNQ